MLSPLKILKVYGETSSFDTVKPCNVILYRFECSGIPYESLRLCKN